MKIKDNCYCVVSHWMSKYLDLSGNELIVFSIIYGFSQDEESHFEGSLSYIQNFINVSRPTAISILDKLIEKKFIIKENFYAGAVLRNRYKVNFDYLANELKINCGNNIMLNVSNSDATSKET